MRAERWRAVVGYNGFYEVSSKGRVRSLDRVVRGGRWKTGRKCQGLVLQQKTNQRTGHKSVCLSRNGNHLFRSVHSLMLEAFVGPRPPGMLGAHNDGISDRNVLSNLRWDTPLGNTADRYKHGTIKFGVKNPLAKLTLGKVRRIRKMRLAGATLKTIALNFNVTPQNIFYIVKGTTWAHL